MHVSEVGMRIRVLAGEYPVYTKGAEGVIINIDHGILVEFDTGVYYTTFKGNHAWYINPNNAEVIHA